MHRVGGAGAGRIDDAVDAQVALRWRTRPNRHRLVRHPHVPCGAIALGEHRHRLESHVAARANDAHGNLSAVRDEHVAHGRHRGMLPCFLGGLRSRLVSNAASAALTLARVSRGWMTSSMNPRSAATYGLANFSRYSAIRAARAAATSG